MNWQPVMLGIALGAGLWLAFSGLRRMFNKKLSEQERKKGFWPMNAGFAIACISMYVMGLLVEPGGG